MTHQTQTQQQTLTTLPFSKGRILQRKCEPCGQHTIADGECSKCQKKRLPLQRRATNQSELEEVPPIVHEVLNSLGQPLDLKTRNFMESRFGRDFSHVRVHTDAKAAESARAVNARAYTVGQDIVFGVDQYTPATSDGQSLLGHELAHVVQQAGRRGDGQPQGVLRADTAEEYEADRIGNSMVAPQATVHSSPVLIGRHNHVPIIQRQAAKQVSNSDSGYFEDAPIEAAEGCIEPFSGSSLDILLKPNTITVVEFSATWCNPCKVLSRILQQECAKYKNSSIPVRFYSVDIDTNETLQAKFAAKGVPQLYIYVGNRQKYHSGEQLSSDFYSQLLEGIVSEALASNSEQKGKMGLSTGATIALFALAGLVLAAGGLGIAALAGATVSTGAALGILGGGLAVGAAFGLLDPFEISKRTRLVGAAEAEVLIRRHFGFYLPGKKDTDKPLHNAEIRPVTQTELKALHQCRFLPIIENIENIIGWTDTGPRPGDSQQTETATSEKVEPTCSNGKRLEHATPEKPVIYYATDVEEAAVLIHEGIHAYASPSWFSKNIGDFAIEGATEYFTKQIAKEIRITSTSAYDTERVPAIERLVSVIGEEALRQAYFQDKFEATDQILGKDGLQNWALDHQIGRHDEAEARLKKAKEKK